LATTTAEPIVSATAKMMQHIFRATRTTDRGVHGDCGG